MMQHGTGPFASLPKSAFNELFFRRFEQSAHRPGFLPLLQERILRKPTPLWAIADMRGTMFSVYGNIARQERIHTPRKEGAW